MDCLFCKIVGGEVPARRVYEDGKVVGFLDIYPVTKGHTLVVPREHYEEFSYMPEEAVCELFTAARRVAQAVREAMGVTGLNVFINEGKVAGQLVPHLHVHVIPRYPNDMVHVPGGRTLVPDGELASVQEVIKQSFASSP